MQTFYYQLGGFQAHTISWFGYDTNRLCDSIFDFLSESDGDESQIELVLGMFSNGASYLLIPQEDMRQFCAAFRGYGVPSIERVARPYPASRFLSLSPITFASKEALKAKLKTLTTKSGQWRKDTSGDDSQANKLFVMRNDQDSGRPAFEQQRVLWRLLCDSSDRFKFNIGGFQPGGLKIRSLMLYSWEIAGKPMPDRMLDFGLVEHLALDLRNSPVPSPSNAVDFVLKDNERLQHNAKARGSYAHGETTVLPKSEFASSVQKVLSEMTGQVLLLLYNATETISALQSLGVETASWHRGISELVAPPPLSYSLSSTHYQRPQRRSLSPPPRRKRLNTRDVNEGLSSSKALLFPPSDDSLEEEGLVLEPVTRPRPRSPPSRPRLPPGVYVVDVQEMYQNLFRLNNQPPFRKAMPDLRVEGSDKWCAGNDCRSLLSMWLKMVSGNSIDSEREQYQTKDTEGAAIPSAPTSFGHAGSGDPYDDYANAEYEDDDDSD